MMCIQLCSKIYLFYLACFEMHPNNKGSWLLFTKPRISLNRDSLNRSLGVLGNIYAKLIKSLINQTIWIYSIWWPTVCIENFQLTKCKKIHVICLLVLIGNLYIFWEQEKNSNFNNSWFIQLLWQILHFKKYQNAADGFLSFAVSKKFCIQCRMQFLMEFLQVERLLHIKVLCKIVLHTSQYTQTSI